MGDDNKLSIITDLSDVVKPTGPIVTDATEVKPISDTKIITADVEPQVARSVSFDDAADVLPNCTLKNRVNGKWHKGQWWQPVFCANCGKDGGFVPEDELTANYCFYLCESPCGEMWGESAAYTAVPMEKFWEKVKQTQIEREGRELTAEEVIEALRDPNHYLTKLAQDRPKSAK